MKLSKFRERSNDYTGKASEIVRQLCFAGIAIIWIFKNGSDKETAVNQHEPLFKAFLVFPLIFLCIALLFDLLQYVIGGATWISFFRQEEKKLIDKHSDPEIKAPEHLNKPIYTFYILKICFMVVAYIFIIVFLFSKL